MGGGQESVAEVLTPLNYTSQDASSSSSSSLLVPSSDFAAAKSNYISIVVKGYVS